MTEADLNLDGALDLVTAERDGNDGGTTVALGDGKGRFTVYGRFKTTSTFAHDIEAGDLDGDGQGDAVLATNGSVWTLIGDGQGTLAPFAQSLVPFPVDSGLADLDTDGTLDLVALDDVSESLLGMLGAGNGTFAAGGSTSVGADPVKLDLGDVDVDGRIDVLVANRSSGTVSVLMGQGDGSFVLGPSIAAIQPADVLLDQVDEDAVLDALIVGTNSVDIHRGLGDGGFQPLAQVAVREAFDLASGHLGLPGGHGFVVATSSGELRAYQAPPKSPYALRTTLSVQYLPYSPRLADLDSDGLMDVAAALNAGVGTGHAAAFLGDGMRVLGGDNAVALEGFSNWAETGDFDSDSIPDLAVVDLGRSLVFLRGSPDGGFRYAKRVTVGSNPFALAVADVDLDGDEDVLLLDYSEARVFVLLGNGRLSFLPFGSFVAGPSPVAILATDLTSDGVPDAAVIGGDFTGFVRTFVGNGNGTFSTRSTRATGPYPNGLTPGDWNGDSLGDLAVTTTSNVVVYSGLAGGGIGSPTFLTAGPSTWGISAGDMDKDGDSDLVVGNFTSVVVMPGNGDGTFSSGAAYPMETPVRSLRVADIDVDGSLDVVVSGRAFAGTPARITVLLGNGNGSLAPGEAFVGADSLSLLVRDLNGDCLPDVVAAALGPRIYTLFNRLSK